MTVGDDRLREVADKAEIQELLGRYALAVDAGALSLIHI